jgi:hypothetical protein
MASISESASAPSPSAESWIRSESYTTGHWSLKLTNNERDGYTRVETKTWGKNTYSHTPWANVGYPADPPFAAGSQDWFANSETCGDWSASYRIYHYGSLDRRTPRAQHTAKMMAERVCDDMLLQAKVFTQCYNPPGQDSSASSGCHQQHGGDGTAGDHQDGDAAQTAADSAPAELHLPEAEPPLEVIPEAETESWVQAASDGRIFGPKQ